VSLLDFVYLEMTYSPVFTAVATDGQKFGLRRVGLLELPFFAMGIKFPRSDAAVVTDLDQIAGYVSQRPIVIFPEGTKTNGRGILTFEEDIVSLILSTKRRIHAVRFDYGFEYASPYNTIDVYGLRSLAKIITQVRSLLELSSLLVQEPYVRPILL